MKTVRKLSDRVWKLLDHVNPPAMPEKEPGEPLTRAEVERIINRLIALSEQTSLTAVLMFMGEVDIGAHIRPNHELYLAAEKAVALLAGYIEFTVLQREQSRVEVLDAQESGDDDDPATSAGAKANDNTTNSATGAEGCPS